MHVKAGDAFFVIEADVFGWSCRREQDRGLSTRRPDGGGALRNIVGRLGLGGGEARVSPDGVIELGRESARIPALKGCTAFSFVPGRIAATSADSHHVRVLAGRRNPV